MHALVSKTACKIEDTRMQIEITLANSLQCNITIHGSYYNYIAKRVVSNVLLSSQYVLHFYHPLELHLRVRYQFGRKHRSACFAYSW